jgi:hypothetical protein
MTKKAGFFFANPAIPVILQRVGQCAGGRDFVMARRRAGAGGRPFGGKRWNGGTANDDNR